MKVKNIYDNTLFLFAVFLITGFILLTLHFKEGENGLLHQLQGWSRSAVTPLVSASSRVGGTASNFISAFQNLKQMKEENSRLWAANQELENRLNTLKNIEEENRRLRSLLEYKKTETRKIVFARVIGSSVLSREKTVIIDRGTREGIKEDFPVLAPAGLVGTVAKAYPYSSMVRLITDARSGVSVRVLETREVGVLEGSSSGRLMVKYLPFETGVKKGDTILTSGLGGVFPAGILVGTVDTTSGTVSGTEKYSGVRSKVDFDKLEEVFIVTDKPAEETE